MEDKGGEPSRDGAEPEASIKIADEVVGVIAGIAAAEVDGVVSLSGGLVGGLSEILGKRSPSRGVKVEIGTHQAALDLNIVVEYGARIPEVAQRVQEAVKRAVEGMTGLEVIEVNIHIQGVSFRREGRADEARAK